MYISVLPIVVCFYFGTMSIQPLCVKIAWRKIRDRKSYMFVKQQKPITFSLELKLTARFSLFFFLFISRKSKIVIS